MKGTCIWFDNVYGYIGCGYYSNNAYEQQIFVHYSNIDKTTMVNPRFRKLEPNDIVEFEEGPGFHMEGTQALNIKVIVHADNDERQEVQTLPKSL